MGPLGMELAAGLTPAWAAELEAGLAEVCDAADPGWRAMGAGWGAGG